MQRPRLLNWYQKCISWLKSLPPFQSLILRSAICDLCCTFRTRQPFNMYYRYLVDGWFNRRVWWLDRLSRNDRNNSHSFINPFINSFTYLSIHSFTHSFNHSFINSSVHPSIHLWIIYFFIHSYINSFVYLDCLQIHKIPSSSDSCQNKSNEIYISSFDWSIHHQSITSL